MNSLLFSLSVVVLCSCLQKQKKPTFFIANARIDLGDVYIDSVYRLSIPIFNTGNSTLIIDTVTASCGCTIPAIKKKEVQPADSTNLFVEYKAADTGRFDKRVIIKSNIDGSFTCFLPWKGCQEEVKPDSLDHS